MKKRTFCMLVVYGMTMGAWNVHADVGMGGTAPAPAPLARSQYLLRSGVAFDAKEDIFGLIRIKEPKNFFKPDIKQVTWWGEFKPFSTWGRPELEAKWFNPRGELMAQQQFRGLVCQLAKTTLKTAGINVKEMQGLWRVEVYMKGQLLDTKQFSIYDPTSGPQQAPQKARPNTTTNFPTVSLEAKYREKEIRL